MRHDLLRRNSSRPDNTWGRGHIPLPSSLANLGRLSDALRPKYHLKHKVYLDDPEYGEVHLITVPVNDRLSIHDLDLVQMLKPYYGLIRIQSNYPETLTFYFAPQDI